MATMMSTQIFLIAVVILTASNAQDLEGVESRMSPDIENITVPIPMRKMTVNPTKVYNQAPKPVYMAGSRVSYDRPSQNDDEEYQQAMRDVGLRPNNNYQERLPYYESNNPYRMSNGYTGNDNYYAQPTSNIQRVIVGDKPSDNINHQGINSEINLAPQNLPPGTPHIDVAMTSAELANFLQNSNFAFINSNQNLRNNFDLPQQNKANGNNFQASSPMMSLMNQNQPQSAPSIFVPAVAFTQPMNNMFQRPFTKQQLRPMMNNQGGNGNLMGASTLTMPMFFTPNVGMTRMPYPNAFNPMMYPSPMFIPNVNPYAPFFPKKNNKNKQKVKSENRDDRDDAEELFEDDVEEIEE